jgi:hypothetical protein
LEYLSHIITWILSTSFSLRTLWGLKEKVAEGRMRGKSGLEYRKFPLTLALSLRERGRVHGDTVTS